MDVSVGVADSFQENEDSIVDFIATLASVIQDSAEILDRDEGRGSRELFLSGIVSNIGLRSSLSALDCGLNLENNYACLISKIPDIQDIREAISTGFIDIDDFDVLIRTFKPIIEMCRPENISVLLQNGGQGLQKPPLNSIPRDLYCENGMKEAPWPGKRSLFPPFILAMLDSITKHANHSNIRLVMFQICREIVGALISCGWKDDDVLTWLSRPALSDLLISLAECGPESDPTEPSQGGLAKKKSCCSSCHIKDLGQREHRDPCRGQPRPLPLDLQPYPPPIPPKLLLGTGQLKLGQRLQKLVDTQIGASLPHRPHKRSIQQQRHGDTIPNLALPLQPARLLPPNAEESLYKKPPLQEPNYKQALLAQRMLLQ
ncbi:putative coiled coil-containing protein [Cryptosporidium canis]|uniref:Coiled coil-containing protein n=1 Tax=Cryptosporidium canis TaxID=195482 RepID=A0A9D5DIS1_9CRYT|nr:putative coiled coil-containing protein [Cryptosporidium canis]